MTNFGIWSRSRSRLEPEPTQFGKSRPRTSRAAQQSGVSATLDYSYLPLLDSCRCGIPDFHGHNLAESPAVGGPVGQQYAVTHHLNKDGTPSAVMLIRILTWIRIRTFGLYRKLLFVS